ncbi:MAG: MBOAT family protein, partial [Gemmataceae bacterium]
MLFNSWKFVVFFLAVWMVYLSLRRHLRWQNLFLLVASYAFYAAWDWRFACLLAGTTVIDYVAGLGLEAAPAGWRRRACLLLSLTSNLTVLGFFKYYNFFLASLDGLLAPAGLS